MLLQDNFHQSWLSRAFANKRIYREIGICQSIDVQVTVNPNLA